MLPALLAGLSYPVLRVLMRCELSSYQGAGNGAVPQQPVLTARLLGGMAWREVVHDVTTQICNAFADRRLCEPYCSAMA